jgi:hypothetical protein
MSELVEPTTDAAKTCRTCHILRPVEQFYRDSKSRDGLKSQCKDCDREQEKGRLKRKHNFSQEAFDELLAKLHGKCPLARKPFDNNGYRAHRDHDHASGAIRGIISSSANSVLGFAGDDPAMLRRAANYVIAAQIYSQGLITPFLSMPEWILKYLAIVEASNE